MLSANKNVPVTLEELVGDYDLRTSVSRVELEAAAKDLGAPEWNLLSSSVLLSSLELSDTSIYEP